MGRPKKLADPAPSETAGPGPEPKGHEPRPGTSPEDLKDNASRLLSEADREGPKMFPGNVLAITTDVPASGQATIRNDEDKHHKRTEEAKRSEHDRRMEWANFAKTPIFLLIAVIVFSVYILYCLLLIYKAPTDSEMAKTAVANLDKTVTSFLAFLFGACGAGAIGGATSKKPRQV